MNKPTLIDVAPKSGLLGTRREMLMGAGCLLASGTALAMKPRNQVDFLGKATIEDLVPKRLADWNFVDTSGLVLPPRDQMQERLYTQLLTRTYADPNGEQIMLLIAYNSMQDGVIQLHRPEICYPAGGFRLTTIEPHVTSMAQNIDIPSRHIVAETGLRREEMIYWTRMGDYFPRRWSDQRWAVFVQNLHGDIPDGLLVRISSITQGVGIEMLDAFARILYANVNPRMRQVLVGAKLR